MESYLMTYPRFNPLLDLEVPDPYNGGPEEYALVFDLVQPAARGLAEQLAALLADPPAVPE